MVDWNDVRNEMAFERAQRDWEEPPDDYYDEDEDDYYDEDEELEYEDEESECEGEDDDC